MMKIALPLADDGSFSLHYGGSARIGLYEIDPSTRTILRSSELAPPAAEPCEWAGWLATLDIKALLVGGMGRGAQVRINQLGIEVVAGLPPAEPDDLVQAWIDGRISAGPNACEGHGGHHGNDAHGGHHDGPCHCSH